MSTGIFNKYTGYHPSTSLRAGNRKSIRLPGYDYSLPGAYFVTVCIQDRKQKLFGDVVGGAMVENDYGIIVRQCWNDLPAHYPHIRLDEFIIMPNHIHGIIVIRDSTFVGARSSRPILKTDGPTYARSSRPIGLSRPIMPSSGAIESETAGLSRPMEFPRTEFPGRGDQNMGRDTRAHKMGRDDHAPTNATIGDTNATDTNATTTGKPTTKTTTLGNIVAYFKYQSTKQINVARQRGVEKIWQRNYYDHIIRDDKSLFQIRRYIRNNPTRWETDFEHHLDGEIKIIGF